MLKPDKDAAIPEMTKIIAKAAFPQGNIFFTMRDELCSIFEDERFHDPNPSLGQPAEVAKLKRSQLCTVNGCSTYSPPLRIHSKVSFSTFNRGSMVRTSGVSHFW